jgi:hypothetical protein
MVYWYANTSRQAAAVYRYVKASKQAAVAVYRYVKASKSLHVVSGMHGCGYDRYANGSWQL